MHDKELDELMSDDFLDSLDGEESSKEPKEMEKPDWVSEDKSDTTYRAWSAILKLKQNKILSIQTLGKVADSKTPKSVYEIKKSEVAKILGISPQSIFRTSSFSPDILGFFENVNVDLLKLHINEQNKQKRRYKKTGIRRKKKEELVDDVQTLRDRVKELECRNVKQTLDLLMSQLPLDLQQKLKK